jgi:CheY-like chemotaxis protein
MLIDDDADMHFIYERVFRKLGLQEDLRQFNNGLEALEFLRSNASEVRIIFSDMNMPLMDGLQLRAAIHSDPNMRCKSIPFIFLSTSARAKEVTRAYELMVQGFFQKGNTIDELETSVKVVLDYWGKCTLPESAAMV